MEEGVAVAVTTGPLSTRMVSLMVAVQELLVYTYDTKYVPVVLELGVTTPVVAFNVKPVAGLALNVPPATPFKEAETGMVLELQINEG
jgi:hypothetical protein